MATTKSKGAGYPMVDLATGKTTCCDAYSTYYGGTEVCRGCERSIAGYINKGRAL